MYTYLVRINESVNIVEGCKHGSQAGFTEVFHHDHNNVHNKIKVHKGVDIAGERERTESNCLRR
jgi:hypothetical protein